MTLEELMKDEFKAGKEAGEISGMQQFILEFLNGIAPVSDNLKKRLSSVTDTKILSKLHKKAAKANSLEEFESYLDKMNL